MRSNHGHDQSPRAHALLSRAAAAQTGKQYTFVSRHPRANWRIVLIMIRQAKKSSRAHAPPAPALVSVVDDDESVRESLPDLLREFGFAAKAFASADEFLTSGAISATHSLILDIAMPGMSGPELQHELTVRGHAIPIIFITARADESQRRQLIAQGAVACLLKPFSEQELRAALDVALPGSRAR